MRTFKQYLEERENSTFSRIVRALCTFVENRQGLLQDLEIKFDPNELTEPFGELSFEGADKPALEDAIQKVEKLATQIDGNAGSSLYEALSDLAHMADDLESIRDLHKTLSWLSKIDDARKIKSSRS